MPASPADRPDTIRLSYESATADLALVGAEPVSWRVNGRELIWSGDPAYWPRHAPILFPVVGASSNGEVRVEGRAYPMPQHGFARDATFTVVETGPDRAHLRLTDSAETRTHYPFAFQFDVIARLTGGTLALAFEVTNRDARPLPYGLGFHPAFPWPFAGGAREDYSVIFEKPEDPGIPDVVPGGLLRPGSRRVPFEGNRLRLDPRLFATDALCLLDAKSTSLRFVAPGGGAIAIAVEDFPHWALWTKETAPFLSIEQWTGHADMAGFTGDLAARASIRLLPPGATARHAVTMRWEEAV